MADGRGGAVPPDRRPRPPAGPGRMANRQDLSQPGPAPAQGRYTPTGGPYGQATRLQQGQAAAPLPARRQAPAAPAGGGAASPATTPAVGGGPAPAGVPADLWSVLARPTRRPDEPLTAGLPVGAGPGPEAMGPATPSQAAQVLSYLASLPFATAQVKRLAVQVDRQPPPELML